MGEYKASFHLEASQNADLGHISSQIDAFAVKEIKHGSKLETPNTVPRAVEVDFHRILYVKSKIACLFLSYVFVCLHFFSIFFTYYYFFVMFVTGLFVQAMCTWLG